MDDTELAIQRRLRGVDFGLFANVRDTDAVTSHAGSDRIAPKRGSQCATLLAVYQAYGPMTDREAGERSGVPSAWKRASDLRRAGWLVPTGEVRDGQRVCKVAT